MKLTPKMKQLSKENEDSQYINFKGILWHIVGTRLNKNGSTSYKIKNTSMKYGFDRFSWIGEDVLNKLR